MHSKEIIVIKKDGTEEPWDFNKILVAVNKAADRAGVPHLDIEAKETLEDWLVDAIGSKRESIETKELHGLVIWALRGVLGDNSIPDSYQEYRDYKNTYCKEFEKLKQEADRIIYLGDNENANFDSSLISTKGSLIKGYLTKSLYKAFCLSNLEKQLTKKGYIYIHDLRDMVLGSVNCCLFDMGNVLKGGFEMSNIKYTEPNSVLTALQVIGDITLVASSQQFGGFTIPEIDKILLPYCKKTFNQYVAYLDDIDPCYDLRYPHEDYAYDKVQRELEQGFQSLELKLNTIPSSRGDFSFTTLTFGHIPKTLDADEEKFMEMINTTLLNTRKKGHGGKRVVFPKLVFLYDKKDVETRDVCSRIFNKAVECSCECMYPDYLSLTGGPKDSLVRSVYEKYGKITSPMGCRAYLSPWVDPDTNECITTGRFNIGAVSLNLPLIASETKSIEEFFNAVKKYANISLDFLNKRYEFLSKIKASTNPMGFCQGGFYGGNLKPEDYIAPILRSATASLGVTALEETSKLCIGKGLATPEGHAFAVSVLKLLNSIIAERKKKDGHLYALYGTPAESLCSTQAKQYAEATGDTQFGDYFSNSFHCHVSCDITPVEKQDYEEELFHLCEGGHIQYIRLTNPENITATKKLIIRGMDKGFYQGVNFDDLYCEHCRKHYTNSMVACPNCGSTDVTVVSRVCGYLGFSVIQGRSRINEGKMSEIADRVSM